MGGFEIHAMPPATLEEAVRDALAARPGRILIAGGDGSVGTAARVVCGTDTALAILPGGTLNHFARDHGIPTDPHEAAAVAINGVVTAADVARANGQLFLNTSSVGAYVAYVRVRERTKKYVGYRVASLLAAVRILISMKSVAVEVEVDGERRHYITPVVFVGIGERETRAPTLGNRVRGGRSCLHLIVVRERRAARLLVVALDAAMRGLGDVARTPEVDTVLADACTITMGRGKHHLAIDGEVVVNRTPLRYELARNALKIVVPSATLAQSPR